MTPLRSPSPGSGERSHLGVAAAGSRERNWGEGSASRYPGSSHQRAKPLPPHPHAGIEPEVALLGQKLRKLWDSGCTSRMGWPLSTRVEPGDTELGVPMEAGSWRRAPRPTTGPHRRVCGSPADRLSGSSAGAQPDTGPASVESGWRGGRGADPRIPGTNLGTSPRPS